MKITLNGAECKRVDELAVGEWGYYSCSALAPGGFVSEYSQSYPTMTPPMGDCYRVARVDDDALDIVFVPVTQAAQASEEHLVACTASHILERRVAELQGEGWRIHTITVTPDSDGGFSYVVLLRRAVSE